MDFVSNIEARPIEDLAPYSRNARTHSKKQIRKIAASIERFGFLNPVLIDGASTILCGHGRIEAAKSLGMERVPVLVAEHLSEAEKKAYILADNRIADEGGWDREVLALELESLMELDFEVELTGFDTAEIDLVIGNNDEAKGPEPEDRMPEERQGPAVTRLGDLWRLGNHRLLCADARQAASYERLLGEERARMVFTDPPYNVAISGHVSGLGKVRHREFAMASGEMSEEDFSGFLKEVFRHLEASSLDGALSYVCMDWRHLFETLEAGRAAFDELKNLCVWNKSNGGMGSLYRSKHELVLVFKKGSAPHVNNVELGATGRYRCNVWDYPGVNSFRSGRMDELAMHPTVKPVALVADAIRDASRRGEIVLDAFAGSGTTLIAAEKTGRRGFGLEIDPAYCDTIVRRWEMTTGKRAVHDASGKSFEELAEECRAEPNEAKSDRLPEPMPAAAIIPQDGARRASAGRRRKIGSTPQTTEPGRRAA